MRLRLVADNGEVPDRPRRCPACADTEGFWRDRERQNRATIQRLKATVSRLKSQAERSGGTPRAAPRPRPSVEEQDLRQQVSFFTRRYERNLSEMAALRAEVRRLSSELDKAAVLRDEVHRLSSELDRVTFLHRKAVEATPAAKEPTP